MRKCAFVAVVCVCVCVCVYELFSEGRAYSNNKMYIERSECEMEGRGIFSREEF